MNRTCKHLIQGLLAGTALTQAAPLGAGELPHGAATVYGGVGIATPSANQMTIRQTTPTAIVNWQGFSIGSGSRVDVTQPSNASALLNRVTGSTPSTIAGQLNANGQVYLVNPNGIAITPTGTVKAAGFVASTLDISDQDFASGRRTFRGGGQSAAVSNQGTIEIGRGGYAALLGGRVDNAGVISVPMGRVGLGAGEQATLDLSGDGFLQVAIPSRHDGSDAALIQHSGRIAAAGGRVVMQAATARDAARNAINLSGLVEARSVSGRNGAIVLGGGEGGSVTVSGRLDASARTGGSGRGPRQAAQRPARGGDITVTGRDIQLTGAALLADGRTGGGTIRVGGGFQGQGPLQRATTTTVDAATTISANAGQTGDGGTVVIWSDRVTNFAGRISATGGAQGGNGGQAEVSGKSLLAYSGTTILTADRGAVGTLLLDPYNVTISNGTDTNQTNFAASGDNSVINATTLQTALRSANVTVTTGGANSAGTQAGDITVAAPLTWGTGTGGAATVLTLSAYHSIAVGANLTVSGDGGLVLNTNQGGTGGTLTFAPGASASFTGGGTAQTLRINDQPYTLLSGVQQLGTFLASPASATGRFALTSDFDATGVALSQPVNAPNGINIDFSGTFNGLGHTINGLTIASSNQYVGLFGRAVNATIESLTLTNVNIRSAYAGTGSSFVGGLAGEAVNTNIFGVSVSGSVSGNTTSAATSVATYTGGLLGANGIPQTADTGGNITRSSSSANVTGGNANATIGSVTTTTGGLIGVTNGGTIAQSSATGTVTGGSSAVNGTSASATINAGTSTGGLIGTSFGAVISDSSASGAVTGGSATLQSNGGPSVAEATTGGLIGTTTGSSVTRSIAIGDVNGGAALSFGSTGSNLATVVSATGGLIGSTNVIGENNATGEVVQSSATGNVTGGFFSVSADLYTFSGSVGGLIGFNSAAVSRSFATGSASFGDAVGGLIGTNIGTVTQVYATGAVSATSVFSTSLNSRAFAVAAGGLIGSNAGTVTEASASGNVSGGSATAGDASSAQTATGGLMGVNSGTVLRAYASGTVAGGSATSSSGTASSVAGGLIGSNSGSVRETYAAGAVTAGSAGTSVLVGGLFGFNQPATAASLAATASASFWDTTTTSQTAAAGNAPTLTGATGLTTAQFQNTGTFVPLATGQGWNFQTTWAPPSAGYYPELYSVSRVIAVTADAQSRLYGQANPTLTGVVSGGPGTYAFGAGTAPNASDLLTTAATPATGVGDYAISPAAGPFVSLGGVSYRVIGIGNTLSVTPAPLTISANNASKTYGQTLAFAGTEFTTTGLANEDRVTRVTLASPGQAASAGVDSYAITAGAAEGTGLVNAANNRSNYTISYNTGALSVTPAPLTISANNASKTYGQTLAFAGTEFTTTGLANEDRVTRVTLASPGQAASAGVDSYAITAGAAEGTGLVNAANNRSNYTISYNTGALSVTPAPLTITANDASKVFGQTLAFAGTEFTTTGLANEDRVTRVTLASPGQAASAGVDSYAITAGAAEGTGLVNAANNRSNYAISYNTGTLTVTPGRQPQDRAIEASEIASANVTPNVTTVLPNFSTAALPLADSVDALSGGPTIGPAQGSQDAGGSQTRAGAQSTLASVQRGANTLEAQVAACDRGNKAGLRGTTTCYSNALDSFADTLEIQVQQLPPAFRSLPAVIRQAARKVRAATTVVEARAAVRVAVVAVRKAIALLRADEPAVARIQVRQGNAIASALRTVENRLSRAVGL